MEIESQRKQETKRKVNSERAELIREFEERLNDPNKRKFGPAFISMKLSDSGLKTNSEIFAFLQDCKRARKFGAYFFWALTSKNDNPNKRKYSK